MFHCFHFCNKQNRTSLFDISSLGSMYIGNIVVWKHHLHLETKNVYRNHTLDIGNIIWILETYELDWKHIQKFYIIWYSTYWKQHFRLETHIYWKHNETSLTGSHVKYEGDPFLVQKIVYDHGFKYTMSRKVYDKKGLCISHHNAQTILTILDWKYTIILFTNMRII